MEGSKYRFVDLGGISLTVTNSRRSGGFDSLEMCTAHFSKAQNPVGERWKNGKVFQTGVGILWTLGESNPRLRNANAV